MATNPIVELAEMVQQDFGKSIQARVVGKSGPDHMPVITVEIELPDGRIFEASSSNQKLAKQRAAEIALEEY
ncbi:MAG TPA: putative dsRNA-binding protein [Cryomorphaceae bacterium]|nr:putative dsRNA-binding protein [Cryomorphaceae bacterium]